MDRTTDPWEALEAADKALTAIADGKCLYSATADNRARCQECAYTGDAAGDITHAEECETGIIEAALAKIAAAKQGSKQ